MCALSICLKTLFLATDLTCTIFCIWYWSMYQFMYLAIYLFTQLFIYLWYTYTYIHTYVSILLAFILVYFKYFLFLFFWVFCKILNNMENVKVHNKNCLNESIVLLSIGELIIILPLSPRPLTMLAYKNSFSFNFSTPDNAGCHRTTDNNSF